MAGDWIKMRNDLAEDPAVIGIGARTSLDSYGVVGRLHKLWGWADRQSRDGHAPSVTEKWIDRYVECDGFASAMSAEGWMALKTSGVSFPNFDRHNGQSAKKRALAADRQRNARVTRTSRIERDESVTREEKRRITTPIPPSGAFLRFWASWPRGERKRAQGKCWELWSKKDFDLQADAILVHVDSMKTTDGWQRGFVPAPLVYLNQRQWEGAELEAPRERRVAMP